jgi:transketolase
MTQSSHIELSHIASKVRRDILSMSYTAKSAHMGGSLSVVEILVVLYGRVMHAHPKDPRHAMRDRLVFSKAHDAKALYATLCAYGFFPKQVLKGYEQDGGKLPGHTVKGCVPGVEISAGSLGHGLSIAAGMAWALNMKHQSVGGVNASKKKNSDASDVLTPRVYAVLSDGECDEGSTWEAALFTGHHKLGNLTVIVDCNGIQGYGRVEDVLNLEPFADKWRAFGFETSVVDGHSFDELIRVLKKTYKKPHVVLAKTVKGYGGPKQYINTIESQYKSPTEEEYKEFVRSL